MGRESSPRPRYRILAYVTLNKDRVLSSTSLALLAKDENEQKEITVDIAKGLKADVVKLKCGDYMVIRV